MELQSCGRAMSWITTPVPHSDTCAEMPPPLQEMVLPQLFFLYALQASKKRRFLLTSMFSRQGRACPAMVTPVRPRPTTCTSNTWAVQSPFESETHSREKSLSDPFASDTVKTCEKKQVVSSWTPES